MKRVGFLLKVKEDKIAEYKKNHEHVWPEVLDALKRNGWHNYTLFLRPDGLMFGYFEASESFEASLAGMAKEPASLKWQEFMKPYFEVLEGMRPDQSMIELEEIAHHE
jgi:L-rhamnose mutarotase